MYASVAARVHHPRLRPFGTVLVAGRAHRPGVASRAPGERAHARLSGDRGGDPRPPRDRCAWRTGSRSGAPSARPPKRSAGWDTPSIRSRRGRARSPPGSFWAARGRCGISFRSCTLTDRPRRWRGGCDERDRRVPGGHRHGSVGTTNTRPILSRPEARCGAVKERPSRRRWFRSRSRHRIVRHPPSPRL